MKGFEAYKIYLAIKNHFTTNYDYFKYGGKTSVKLETFTRRKDRFFFYKLSTKYNLNELVEYFVANFIDDTNKWVGDIVRTNGDQIYEQYKLRRESITYSFRSDLVHIDNALNGNSISFDDYFSVVNGQHNGVIKQLIGKKISIESFIILDDILGLVKRYDKEISEKIIWPGISKKIKKYKPFLKYNVTQCKKIMREKFL